MGVWEKLDSYKENLASEVQDKVGESPLDYTQAIIIAIIGAAITESTLGWFPIMTLSIHISSLLNLLIGVGLLAFAFIWWGLHYA